MASKGSVMFLLLIKHWATSLVSKEGCVLHTQAALGS